MSDQENWEQRYRDGATPWDIGRPCEELQRVLQSGVVQPCRTLDLGCGTGTNAVYLAQRGFDVTGVDVAQNALEKAREKAAAANVNVRFLHADVCHLPDLGEPFDFVYDRGCFHTFKERRWEGFMDTLERATYSGSLYLMLCGNAKEPREHGPPTLTEEEIRAALSPLFDFEWMNEFRFSIVFDDGEHRPLAWSCLMRRR